MKHVAIKTPQGWRQTPARPLLCAGSGPGVFALNRAPATRGWRVTAIACGLSVGRGRTQALAVLDAEQRIAAVGGLAAALAAVAAEPAAPPVSGLPFASTHKPLRSPQEGVAPESVLAGVLAQCPDLDPAEQSAVLRALAGQGRFRGRLLAKCPPSTGAAADPLAAAAWLGLQPNPYKISVWRYLIASTAAKALTDKLARAPRGWPVWLDRDADALCKLGVW
jgi:hypothetical protein